MLAGNLTEFSLPDVFQLLATTKKSGALRVVTDGVEGRVYFNGGEVYFASADCRRLALGARLVGAGLLTEEQLEQALERRKESGAGDLAELLLAEGVIDEGQLDTFVREQIIDAVFDLMRRDEGEFTFDAAEGEEVDAAVGIAVATDQLVMESSRRMGEWATIRERIPTTEAVLAMNPTPPSGTDEVALTAQQWQLLTMVDGQRSVRDIAELTGKGDFATCHVLSDLVAGGLLEVVDRSSGERSAIESLLARRVALRRLEELEVGDRGPQPTGEGETGAADEPVLEEPEPPLELAEPVVEEPAFDEAVVEQPAEQPEAATPRPRLILETAVAESATDLDLDEETPEAETPVATDPEPATDAETVTEPDAADADPEPPESDTPAPGPRAQVDRAQVARELASLGLDEDMTPKAKPVSNGVPEPAGDKQLTRDEDLNKGLLLRLIEGVKGA